jgi:hypothetical protein
MRRVSTRKLSRSLGSKALAGSLRYTQSRRTCAGGTAKPLPAIWRGARRNVKGPHLTPRRDARYDSRCHAESADTLRRVSNNPQCVFIAGRSDRVQPRTIVATLAIVHSLITGHGPSGLIDRIS